VSYYRNEPNFAAHTNLRRRRGLCSGTLYPYVRPPRARTAPAPPAATIMRFILRFIGLWLLAGAFVALIIDGTGSIAGGSTRFTSFGQTWDNLSQESKPAVKAFVDRHAPPWVWTSGVQTVLDQPTWIVLGVLGAVLVLLGRRKPRLIGYTRE
jgi:hypothetical protein